MDLGRLGETDLFGRFFLRSHKGRFEGYYRSLDTLRPLLTSDNWKRSVTGFYVNVAGDYDAVRLSYFTILPKETRTLVDSFAAECGLTNIQEPEIPRRTKVSECYGGEELRFRRFLSTQTLIGLDIMKADLHNARCLLATFRWQIMIARKPYKPHFLRTLENQSPFYNSLQADEKEQFWRDLAYWPNPPQVDWAHFLVNMVLGCDWNNDVVWPIFVQSSPSLSVSQINEGIKSLGFQIPEGWKP